MTLTPGDDLNEDSRQRTRDQFALLRSAHGPGIIVDTDDPADFNFICSSQEVLLPGATPESHPDDPDDPVQRLLQWFGDRSGEFDTVPDPAPQGRTGLSRRLTLPSRRQPAPDGKDLLVTLAEIDDTFGPGFATPNHLIHLCPAGKGTICPATEPTETACSGPWPPEAAADSQAGASVKVVVIDTGYDARTNAATTGVRPWPWLAESPAVTGVPEPGGLRRAGYLRPYAGHGTFVAGVIRSMAPACEVKVLNLLVDRAVPGGGVFEAQLVDRLYDALKGQALPQLINMSAGCPTRLNLPSRAFEQWRQYLVDQRGDPDLVLVAAAGNNSSPWGFWPASFDWATGVGSLDRDGGVSSFSNWGDSVDVYALGRNVVNAFPKGTYVCNEAPDRGDTRIFDNGLARWSGTSFAAPLVTGLIAAQMSGGSMGARDARDAVVASAVSTRPAVTARTAPVAADQLLRPDLRAPLAQP